MRSLLASLTLLTGTTAFTPIHHHHAMTKTSSTSLRAAVPSQSNFLTPELAATCIATASGTPLY